MLSDGMTYIRHSIACTLYSRNTEKRELLMLSLAVVAHIDPNLEEVKMFFVLIINDVIVF